MELNPVNGRSAANLFLLCHVAVTPQEDSAAQTHEALSVEYEAEGRRVRSAEILLW